LKKVVVIGAGNWGKNLIRNFYDLNALGAVVEANDVLRESTQENYPDIAFYADLAEVINEDFAFAIATPAATHFAIASEVLAKGKDVFIEKPMTLTTVNAKILLDQATKTGQILMVGHLLLYQPAIVWIRDYLLSGEAGRVWHVSTRRAKLGKVRKQENVWWSFAPHDVSVVLELLGRPKLNTVKAQGHAMLQSNVEDNVDVLLEFDSGQTAHIHSSWLWPKNERSTTIICEKKMIVYDEVAQTVTISDKGINADLSNRDEGKFIAEVASDQPLRLECQHFLDCLLNRQQPRSDAQNGLYVVEILEKAHKAMQGAQDA